MPPDTLLTFSILLVFCFVPPLQYEHFIFGRESRIVTTVLQTKQHDLGRARVITELLWEYTTGAVHVLFTVLLFLL